MASSSAISPFLPESWARGKGRTRKVENPANSDRDLAVPSTSAGPERMFSLAGNIMTKKRARLSCDHLEELMYLHEVWPKMREWTAIKKARLA